QAVRDTKQARAHPLLALQRTAGNRAVTALVLQRQADPADWGAADVARELPRIAAGDRLRQEYLLRAVIRMTEAEGFNLLAQAIDPSPNPVAAALTRFGADARYGVIRTLLGKLGHDNVHIVRDELLAGASERFAGLVPDPVRRNALLTALAARLGGHGTPASGSLWVSLSFRSSGAVSAENESAVARTPRWGGGTLGPVPGRGNNAMEIRGDVAGDHTDVVFDFKRLVTRDLYHQVDGVWVLRDSMQDVDDDSNDSDEDLTPSANGHIYSFDAPGPYFPDRKPAHSASHILYTATFGEWVVAKNTLVGEEKNVSDRLEWHSITKLAKKADGSWGRDPEFPGQIGPGAGPVGKP
ncbi:MAG TPA: hypothetical protein VGF17_12480, partial [Phytomonospora sp.]